MASTEPNILYSANSSLAYRISKEFYEDLHFVWCSTRFGSPSGNNLFENPTSSRPYDRFLQMQRDTGSNPDRHSDIVTSQKAGLKRGALLKFRAKVISKSERDEIIQIVDQAETADFKPLMYVVPYSKVSKMAKKVPVTDRAHPFSDEWIIDKLPGKLFDIITF